MPLRSARSSLSPRWIRLSASSRDRPMVLLLSALALRRLHRDRRGQVTIDRGDPVVERQLVEPRQQVALAEPGEGDLDALEHVLAMLAGLLLATARLVGPQRRGVVVLVVPHAHHDQQIAELAA